MGKKRKVFSGAFKARVALEVIREVEETGGRGIGGGFGGLARNR